MPLPLRPATSDELAAFLGLDSFSSTQGPMIGTIVVDNQDAEILIGANGFVICTEEGTYESMVQPEPTTSTNYRTLGDAIWALTDELCKCWEDGTYVGDKLRDIGWEFSPAN